MSTQTGAPTGIKIYKLAEMTAHIIYSANLFVNV